MARLRPLHLSDLNGPQLEVYGKVIGRLGPNIPILHADSSLGGPFNAFIHNPTVGGPMLDVGQGLNAYHTLSNRMHELVILMVAVAEQSEFEWFAHSILGLRQGLQTEEIASVFQGADVFFSDATEQVIFDATKELLRMEDLSDEAYARCEDQLGSHVIVELVTLIGHYRHLAFQLRIFRVPIPDSVEPAFRSGKDQLH